MPVIRSGAAAALVVALYFIAAASAAAQTAVRPKPQSTHTRPWSVDFSLQTENQGEGQPTQNEFDATVTRTVNPRLSITGGLAQHDRFNVLDTQANIGASVKFRDHISVSGTFTEGFGAEMTSRHQISLKGSGLVARRWQPLVEFEHKWYIREITLTTLTLGVGTRATPRLGLQAKYIASDSQAKGNGQAGSIGMSYGVNRRVTVTGGFGYGDEHYRAKTEVEVVRKATVLDLQGGATFHLAGSRDLHVSYEFQDYKNLYSTQTVIVGVTLPF
jgi:YaiO family outer membrane protein